MNCIVSWMRGRDTRQEFKISNQSSNVCQSIKWESSEILNTISWLNLKVVIFLQIIFLWYETDILKCAPKTVLGRKRWRKLMDCKRIIKFAGQAKFFQFNWLFVWMWFEQEANIFSVQIFNEMSKISQKKFCFLKKTLTKIWGFLWVWSCRLFACFPISNSILATRQATPLHLSYINFACIVFILVAMCSSWYNQNNDCCYAMRVWLTHSSLFELSQKQKPSQIWLARQS